MSVEIPILADAVMVFGLSCAVIVASHKLRIPTIIGFLLTGVLAGPHCLGLVGASHEVEMFAEVGVILLLFVIGLELSLDELIRLKRPVFVGGAAQVLLTIAVMGLPLMFFDVGLGKSLFIGFLAALSSTAIVLKVLGEKAQLPPASDREWFVLCLIDKNVTVPVRGFVVPRAHIAAAAWIQHMDWLTDESVPDGKRNAPVDRARVYVPSFLAYEGRWDLLEESAYDAPVLLPPRFRELALEPRVGLPPKHPWLDRMPDW